MPHYSLKEAADRAGVSKTTMHSNVKNGKLSAEKDENGAWRIEASELARVYPENANQNTPNAQPNDQPNAAERVAEQVLNAKIEGLERERDLLRAQLERAEAREQQQLEVYRTAMRLLPPPTQDTREKATTAPPASRATFGQRLTRQTVQEPPAETYGRGGPPRTGP